MTEQPDDSYPASWRPQHIKERDAERAEFELHVAALSDEEIARIRGGEN